MGRQICLDSDIVINHLRGDESIRDVLQHLRADFCITSINLFELWYGRKESETITQFLSTCAILSLDYRSAILAANIQRALKIKGNTLDIKDLLIGSICIVENVSFLTLNKKHFERLQHHGLRLV
ncbi:type II toxin-antitoxin system VapC family toxin [Candidatus Woesearchaeota archaeon]|nr:type II toxin-antitoxin system VapC family toxin [Candidatus Woesearchaeota archaeon]